MPVAETDVYQPVFKEMPPGPGLALLLGAQDRAQLDDFDIVELARSARRLASWATSLEFGAIAELSARRKTQGERLGAWDSEVGEWVTDEIAAALTLSGGAAAREVVVAQQLTEHLPRTYRALTDGLIDTDKAKVIADGVRGSDPAIARRVEQQVLPAAPAQTCGQLRYAVRKAVRDADPDAQERRRKDAEEARRMELWDNDDGTSDLSGRNLPNSAASAAANRINAIAQGLKADGDPRTIDQLRADVYLALLRNDRPDDITTPEATNSGCDDPLAPSSDVRTHAGAGSVPDKASSHTSGDAAYHSKRGAEAQRGTAAELTARGGAVGGTVPGLVEHGQAAGGAAADGGLRRSERGAENLCGPRTGPGCLAGAVANRDERRHGEPTRASGGTGTDPGREPESGGRLARTADGGKGGSITRGVSSRDADAVSGNLAQRDTGDDAHRNACNRGACGDVRSCANRGTDGDAEGESGGEVAGRERVEDRQQPAELVGGLIQSERGGGQTRAPEFTCRADGAGVCEPGSVSRGHAIGIVPAGVHGVAIGGSGSAEEERAVAAVAPTSRQQLGALIGSGPRQSERGGGQARAPEFTRRTADAADGAGSGEPGNGSGGFDPAEEERAVAAAVAGAFREELAGLTGKLSRDERRLGGQAVLVREAARRMKAALSDLQARWCVTGTGHGVDSYRVPAAMRRSLQIRDKTCRFPGCSGRADKCDVDHTIAFHKGGPTCPCNLASLCRRHHRLKQRPEWELVQVWHGVLLWIAPTGHWYVTGPDACVDRR